MNMEVITIESVAYQQLMGRIESIASHIERLEATRGVQENPDTLLNTREAAEILHISIRTLQRLRSEKRIDFCAASISIPPAKSGASSMRDVSRAILLPSRNYGIISTCVQVKSHLNDCI